MFIVTNNKTFFRKEVFYHAEAKQVKKNHFAYNNKLSL